MIVVTIDWPGPCASPGAPPASGHRLGGVGWREMGLVARCPHEPSGVGRMSTVSRSPVAIVAAVVAPCDSRPGWPHDPFDPRVWTPKRLRLPPAWEERRQMPKYLLGTDDQAATSVGAHLRRADALVGRGLAVGGAVGAGGVSLGLIVGLRRRAHRRAS